LIWRILRCTAGYSRHHRHGCFSVGRQSSATNWRARAGL